MTHLYIDLYDNLTERLPCCSVEDHDINDRQYFHDLQMQYPAVKAVRVVIRPGDEYRTGDHIQLLHEAWRGHTDTVVIDPAVAHDVDLNHIPLGNHSFTDQTGAILIITNPNPNNVYRLRVSLYSQLDQRLPSLIFYDWEYPGKSRITDLSRFHFTKKANFLRVERGPDFVPGDKVVLWETLDQGSQTCALEPGNYDLSQLLMADGEDTFSSIIESEKSWAEAVAGITFDLQPKLVGIRA